MAEKVILAFCIEPKKERQMKALCQKKNITYKAVNAGGYQKTLGNLAGIKGIPVVPTEKKEGIIPSVELLVFSGFSQEDIFTFADGMRAEQISDVPLKAMLTMHNVFWSPRMLFEEILKEQRKLRERDRI